MVGKMKKDKFFLLEFKTKTLTFDPKIKTDFMNRIMVNTYWWRFLQLNKS